MSMLLLSPRLNPIFVPTARRPKLQPLVSEPVATRHISSTSLLDGARELVIQHQGSEYHLRLTRNDKLILTK